MEQKFNNYQGRPESLTAEKEHSYGDSRADGHWRWERDGSSHMFNEGSEILKQNRRAGLCSSLKLSSEWSCDNIYHPGLFGVLIGCKLRAGRNLDAMILGVGNDVQDALVRQTIGIQPYLSLPRINDVPVQWVQLLNGFDQQDLYGWPLPTPLKVQMQKCDKCSREFCSTINYRRHIRVHRRSNVDKESHKNRDSLGAFWDKVSLDEVKKILSFEDVILEGVPGTSIIKALASFVRAPGFCALPQVYVKAGYVLLDVIEASPSRLPISSQEFFTVLDDASESTFLCGGSAGSLQKFIFDGEAGKVGLEMKNLVACTSFLVEQNLVKAWIADKDAEALRCQKLLVEEEEAAQRRQAELLERKRLRKLRQKEQKTKGRSYKETTKLTGVADILENVSYAKSSSPPQSAGELHALEDHNSSLFEAAHVFNNEVNGYIDIEGGYTSELLDSDRAKNVELPESEGNNNRNIDDSKSQVLESMSEHIDIEGKDNSELLGIGTAKNVESPESQGNNNPHIVDSKTQVLESMGEQNALHPSHNLDVVKPDPMQKLLPPRDPRVAQVNSTEIGTSKGTVENGRECVTAMLHEEEISLPDRTSCEVMIGSISVTVGNCIAQKRNEGRSCRVDHVTCGTVGAQDKQIKPESPTDDTSLSNDRCWRPLKGHEVESQFFVQSGVAGVGTMTGNFSLGSSEVDNDSKQIDFVQPAKLALSSHSARAFLSQRWKEAISGDHETLVLSQEPEHQGQCDATNDDSEERSILGSAGNRLGTMEALKYPTDIPVNAKPSRKPKKGYLIKVQC